MYIGKPLCEMSTAEVLSIPNFMAEEPHAEPPEPRIPRVGEYSCRDEGMCDCLCPNQDCIHYKQNHKEGER